MKNYLLIIIVVSSITSSCQGPQKSTLSGDNSSLTGTWELKSATTPNHKFEELFSEKIPQIILNLSDSTVNGNSSCNNFNGKFEAKEGRISFSQNMAMTKMFCPGEGEKVFMELLTKASAYSIVSENELQLFAKESMLLKFSRK